MDDIAPSSPDRTQRERLDELDERGAELLIESERKLRDSRKILKDTNGLV
ncbi:MAG: hypothetical protein H0V46_06090 [Sphingomonas sp.]|nr:hypothetical protein [Sphingomonas sp.]